MRLCKKEKTLTFVLVDCIAKERFSTKLMVSVGEDIDCFAARMPTND